MTSAPPLLLHGLIDGLPSDRPTLLAETSGLNSRRSQLLWVDLPFCRYAGLRQTDRQTDDAIPQPAPFCITRRSVSVKRLGGVPFKRVKSTVVYYWKIRPNEPIIVIVIIIE